MEMVTRDLNAALNHKSNRWTYFYFTSKARYNSDSIHLLVCLKLLQPPVTQKSIQKVNSTTIDHLFLGRIDILPTLLSFTSAKTRILISLVFKEYKIGLMQGGMHDASDRYRTRRSESKDRT